MKKIAKVLLPGALAFAFFAAPVATTPVLAQDAAAAATPNPEREALDKKFRDNRTSNPPVAYQAAKEYLQKYSNDSDNQDFVKYLQGWVPKYEERERLKEEEALYKNVNDPYVAKNWAGVFTGGRAFLAKKQGALYPVLLMTDAGYQLALAKNDTYTNDTVNYAKQTIQMIESGKAPENGTWFPFKDKNQALAWANYTIGFVMFDRMKDQEIQAAPYFYKALQLDADIKKAHLPYYAIGYAYQQQYNKLVAEWQKIAETVTEPTEETKRLEAEFKGVADRAIDAFARAYKAAEAGGEKSAPARDNYKKTLTDFYKVRFAGKDTGLDAVIAGVATKPLPDPTTKPEPVYDTPATTTTGATAPNGTATTTAATGTTTAAKPATTNGAAKTSQKPATTANKTNGTRPQR